MIAGSLAGLAAGERAASPAQGAAEATPVKGADPCRRSITAGRSVVGRRIVAITRGCPGGRVRALVVGSIHGDETAGHAVVRRLRRLSLQRDVELWTVRTVNPDGVVRDSRQNGRGVDLNRNFPHRWRAQGRPFDTYYPGRAPFSEPESRAVRSLVRRVRPHVTIWYHQALRLVDSGSGADRAIVRAYSNVSRLPLGRIGFLPGVATRWQNRSFPGSSAFVVELPGGALSGRGVSRHVRAVRSALRVVAEGESTAAVGSPNAPVAPSRPRIVQWRIPFGHERKRQMRAYARRHYGIDDHRLRDARVVVLHLSVTDTARAVYETFAPNRPDPELRELPGVCAHFVVDQRGRIYQLVSLALMCRHTVGLNHVSIGIEHVGRREVDVFGRDRQLRASLRLVEWLQRRFGIAAQNVIGHNESLDSPYHYERVRRLRRQTHADFPKPAARRYRRLLAQRQ